MKSSAGERLKAVIIGSADVIKLCVIRAVGVFGCDIDVVHVGTKNKKVTPIDYYSKYVNHYFFCRRTDIIQLLLDNCTSSYTKPIIFTLDDFSTFIIDDAREELKNYFQFAYLNSGEHIAGLMNKHLLKKKATEVGMNVVKGWPIPFENGTFQIPEGIKYPCFVKGLQSIYVSKGVQCKCDNKEELCNLLEKCKIKYPYSVYVEEFIQIEKDFGVIGVSDGRKCMIPAKAELLEMGRGSTNGVSMLGRVSPLVDTSLFKQIEALIKEIHYVGIFNLDFVKSNGKIFFVELNFRFAAYGYAVFCAGCNIPALFINALTGKGCESTQTTMHDTNYYYFNEKIGIINVIEKSLKYTRYRKLKKQSDCCLVHSKEDPLPYRWFLVGYFVRYIKSRIKSYSRRF